MYIYEFGQYEVAAQVFLHVIIFGHGPFAPKRRSGVIKLAYAKAEQMFDANLVETLKFFFPGAFETGSDFVGSSDGQLLLKRLSEIKNEPLHLTNFNQLLHLNHEAGISQGCFRYYFQTVPENHPYPVMKISDKNPPLNHQGIESMEQLFWGIRRFYVDGLLYWGNLRSAYRDLRKMSFQELEKFYEEKRFPTKQMTDRGEVLPFYKIQVDDRYLISETACKAYSGANTESTTIVEELLLSAFKRKRKSRVKISELFDEKSQIAKNDRQDQFMLQLATEEFMDDYVETEEELKEKIHAIADRFVGARESALKNTRLYLSIVNELDVYVATSMRKREDFRNMARESREIFTSKKLREINIRYFDPTNSATDAHEDKGLLECLMVKCAKAVLYFAGDRDSYGKDSEIAMALSLGKPVIILCPDNAEGKQREKFFRDIHPLSRLIEFETGIAIGAMVTRDRKVAAELLSRIFRNEMEYKLETKSEGYFVLKEKLTGSTVRLQTSWSMLQESFWNYYHGVS